MRARIDCRADGSKRAHTVRKSSLVHKIIQRVEYPALRACVAKISEHDTQPRSQGIRSAHTWAKYPSLEWWLLAEHLLGYGGGEWFSCTACS